MERDLEESFCHGGVFLTPAEDEEDGSYQVVLQEVLVSVRTVLTKICCWRSLSSEVLARGLHSESFVLWIWSR